MKNYEYPPDKNKARSKRIPTRREMKTRYTDKAGQEWKREQDGWHFNDGAGGDWFVLDRDMQAIIQEEGK